MTTPSNENLKIVFGAMTFGDPNTLGARVHTTSQATAILDIFQSHGHKEIDTARIYGAGSSERLLASLDWQKRGFVMDTKLYPDKGSAFESEEKYSHSPEDLRRGLAESLKALKTEKLEVWYLHGPDRQTDFLETVREVNNLYTQGLFKSWGISNFQAWEVSAVCEVCIAHDWKLPSVYQGIYHMFQRKIEEELFSCLRKYSIRLYAFQPLAGGFLTGRYSKDQKEFEKGSRFDPKIMQGRLHRDRYWNDTYFEGLEKLKSVGGKFDLTVAEIALRWLKWHSQLKAELGDAIIVGASSEGHLESNLVDLEKGRLPEEVVKVAEEVWFGVKGVAPKY